MPEPSDPAHGRPRLPRWFLWVAPVLIVLIPFLVAELYVRAKYEPVDLWVLTGREAGPNPMREWAVTDAFAAFQPIAGRQYGDRKTVNRHGFISTPDLKVEKPDGTVRIVFLGGSSTAATGGELPDVETWPWQTVERLRERVSEPRIEFINGAVAGYTTFESYGRLWSRIRAFSPDIIVVDHAWNEMYYFDQVDRIHEWRTRPDGGWGIEETVEPVAWHRPLLVDHLIRPSQLLTRIRFLHFPTPVGGEAAGRPVPEDSLASDYDRRGPEVFRTNLRLLQQAAEVMEAQLFVVKQPTLIVPGLSASERRRARYHFHGFGHEAHVDAFQALYRVIDQEIPADRVIDATSLSGTPEFFFDHIHPTADGAAALARVVADALTPGLRRPRR